MGPFRKTRVLTVTMNPALDRFVRTRGVSKRVSVNAGGKGVNVARSLRVLGVPVTATGLAGGAAGRMLRDLMDGEGLPHDFAVIAGETRTNVTVIDAESGRTSRTLSAGPRLTGPEIRRFLKKIDVLTKGVEAVVISGRLPEGIPSSVSRELVARCSRRGTRVYLDTSGPSLRAGLKARPFAVKPNRQEMEEMLGKKISRRPEIKEALRWLARRGVNVPVISLDKDGAAAFDGVSYWLARPPRVKVHNTVGCGDAFLAGLTAALMKGENTRDALVIAVGCGTAAVLGRVPGRFTKADLRRCQRAVTLRKI